jgi:transposase-like protein
VIEHFEIPEADALELVHALGGNPNRCGPMVCHFPPAKDFRWRARWTCPECGTTYVRRRKIKRTRWWRNWFAPDGHWELPFWSRLRL